MKMQKQVKRIISVVLVIAIAAIFSISVFADTASEKARLIKAIEDFTIEVEGGTLKFEKADINAAKNFITSEFKNDISAAMVDNAIAKMNAAGKVVKDASSYAKINSFKDIRNLKQGDKEAILGYANEAVDEFGLKVVYNSVSSKVDYVRKADDTVAYESSAAMVVKKTGESASVLPMVAVVVFVAAAVIGSAIVVKKYALAK